MQVIPSAGSLKMTDSHSLFSAKAVDVFQRAIFDYHVHDSLGQELVNPFPDQELEYKLYQKCWIDTVQWHVEDEIRRPDIAASDGLALKRRIDGLNQQRTTLVERLDDYFMEKYRCAEVASDARVNSESPAWAVDRLSILLIKIYHMEIEVTRKMSPVGHSDACRARLNLLNEQKADLSTSIDELLEDIALGRKRMKVYRQVKMYNDQQLNPVFYSTAEKKPNI